MCCAVRGVPWVGKLRSRARVLRSALMYTNLKAWGGQAGRQAAGQAFRQAFRQAGRISGRQAGRQAGGQAKLQRLQIIGLRVRCVCVSSEGQRAVIFVLCELCVCRNQWKQRGCQAAWDLFNAMLAALGQISCDLCTCMSQKIVLECKSSVCVCACVCVCMCVCMCVCVP